MLEPLPIDTRNDRGTDGVLLALVELAIQVLFSWTLAYHLCLLLALPAQVIVLPFLAVLGALIGVSTSRWRLAIRTAAGSWRFVAATLCVGAALGLLSLIVSRPDADDVQYFHRALLQLGMLDQPFLRTDGIHNVAGLPLSSVLTITSYEMWVAMAADLLGVDPLYAFHGLVPLGASLLVTTSYLLCFRQLGLGPGMSLAATVGVLGFLLLDGNVHRSFGNITLLRLWQGKALVFALFLPLGLLASHRFLERPGPGRFLLALGVSVAGAGASSSGLFLIPALVFAVSVAFILNHGLSRELVARCVVLNLASVYSACILLAMIFGVLPTYALDELFASWPSTWTANLALVVDSGFTLARNLILLLAVPAVLLPNPHGRFLVLLSLVLMALFTNPVTGPIFLGMLHPGAFWRVALLFPVPLCAGLLARAFAPSARRAHAPRVGLGLGVAALGLAAIAAAYEHSTLAPAPGMPQVWRKAPAAYRFPPRVYRFSAAVSDRLAGRNLLAPEAIARVVPLLNPTVRLEAARGVQTRFVFAGAGREAEGVRRVEAQRLATDCRPSPSRLAAFSQALEGGVDAVVLGHCNPALRGRIRERLRSFGVWEIAHESEGFALLLRSNASSTRPGS